jgi:thiosulfate dehydrogenase
MNSKLRTAAPALVAALVACAPAAAADAARHAPFAPPDESTIPAGPLGDAIRLGERVLTHTRVAAGPYVGNALNCTSCHLGAGRTPYASPWVGVYSVFPEYRSRSGAVASLQDRVNDCFRRSLNGKPLPDDSREMQGIVAYMAWLSRGVPTGVDVEGRGFRRIASRHVPDEARGRQVFSDKCALCHGQDGQGQRGADGDWAFPPLWGAQSFNIGAGMARLGNAAAFVRWNMPLGQGGSLSDDEALDVAAFFTRQPRPDFAPKSDDWPQGGRPDDARY